VKDSAECEEEPTLHARHSIKSLLVNPELWKADSPRHMPLWKQTGEESLEYLMESVGQYHKAERDRQKKA